MAAVVHKDSISAVVGVGVAEVAAAAADRFSESQVNLSQNSGPDNYVTEIVPVLTKRR